MKYQEIVKMACSGAEKAEVTSFLMDANDIVLSLDRDTNKTHFSATFFQIYFYML